MLVGPGHIWIPVFSLILATFWIQEVRGIQLGACVRVCVCVAEKVAEADKPAKCYSTINLHVFLIVHVYLLNLVDIVDAAYAVLFLEYPHSHVVGGHRYRSAVDKVTCVQACRRTRSCFAVDFDVRDRSCWFHGALGVCRRPLTKPRAVHVKLVPCCE